MARFGMATLGAEPPPRSDEDEESGISHHRDGRSTYHFGKRAAIGHCLKRHWFR